MKLSNNLSIVFLLCLISGVFGEPNIRVLSEHPRIYAIDQFLSAEECRTIILLSQGQLTRSTVVNPLSTEGQVHSARTSQGMFFPQNPEHKVLKRIEKRIAALTEIPRENGEGLQVLFYPVGAQYLPHYDYFSLSSPGGAAHYNRGGQRVATVIMYLNTVEEGGETIFPKAKLSIAPVKGNAILFYNCTPDGKEDPLTLHGGAPVLKGEKWILTKWLRQREFR